MSKPVDPGSTPTARPVVRRHRPGRLHENFKVTTPMKPYANRIQLRVAHNKRRLENARREMTHLLTKKKVRRELAQQAVIQALDIAADHQLEALRRSQNLTELTRSQISLERLLEQLDALKHEISKLPPLAKVKFNKIVAGQDWENFDTETFSELIHAMIDALSTSSAITDKARSAIIEPLRASKHPAVAQIIRTAPPTTLDLWDVIPAQTRTRVEAKLRTWVPSSQRPANEFLNRLISLLERCRPRPRKGRRHAIERRFGRRLASIWRGLGLHVGRAFDGESGRHVESSFQRFARLALTNVGDDSRISNRQIESLKATLQRPR